MTKTQIEKLTAEIVKAIVPAIRDAAEQAQLRAIHNEPNELSRPFTKAEFKEFVRRGHSLQPNGHGDKVKFL